MFEKAIALYMVPGLLVAGYCLLMVMAGAANGADVRHLKMRGLIYIAVLWPMCLYLILRAAHKSRGV